MPVRLGSQGFRQTKALGAQFAQQFMFTPFIKCGLIKDETRRKY